MSGPARSLRTRYYVLPSFAQIVAMAIKRRSRDIARNMTQSNALLRLLRRKPPNELGCEFS